MELLCLAEGGTDAGVGVVGDLLCGQDHDGGVLGLKDDG